MYKTLRQSFSLKNTYRVNSILYALKQVPLLKKILPDELYKVRELKILANVLSVIWEILTVFVGKLLYFILMIYGMGMLYAPLPADRVFVHLLLFLTIVGGYMNTSLFNPSRDKYYAIILLRMNAREYTVVNYGYAMVKVVVGFLPFAILFGLLCGVPLWFCLLIPFCVAGLKLGVAAFSLWNYEKSGFVYNESKIRKYLWLFALVLLALAYGLPAVGVVLPEPVSMALLLAFIPLGAVSIPKLLSFRYYREIHQQLLAETMQQMDTLTDVTKKQVEKTISADTAITSKRKGFDYLNELFIKRHQKILWKSTQKIAAVCAALICGVLLVMYLAPDSKPKINELMLHFLPYFTFIMYAINRGTGFTQALFMNCDHSLLTYSFYKQPKCVLKLFRIRLWEIIKNQCGAGHRHRRRAVADFVCLRRNGPPALLWGAVCVHSQHERVFLHPLFDPVLSVAAL